MKKRIAYGIFICMICFSIFYLVYQWKELNRFANQAGLRYETGGLSQTQIEEYNKKRLENAKTEEGTQQIEITAWKREKEQNVIWKDTGQQTKGTVITVYGNMARILPFSMKYGGYTFPADAAGCVVSSGLAWKLFGAEDVVGNVVQYGERKFQIHGVLDMEESVLAIYQTNRQEAMPYVEVWNPEEPPAPRLEQIESSIGMFGASYEFTGSFYCSIARILLSIPFWLIFYYLCRCFFRWCNISEEAGRGRYGKWCRIAGKVVMFLGIVIGIFFSISFTSDFIPVQWSDFSFWSEKWQGIAEGIQRRGEAPGIYWEQEVIGSVRRIAGGGLVLLTGIWGGEKKLAKK